MASSGGYLKSSAKRSHFVVLYSTGNEDEYPAKDLEASSAWAGYILLPWSLFIIS